MRLSSAYLRYMVAQKEYVILVDENDNALGLCEKMEAHEKALLHRAFSVLLFNEKKELLLQQRAITKYHCGGKWTNTCCSHPQPDESTEQAAKRRLMEEMGVDCQLKKAFEFIYKAPLEKELTEYEYDHVFIGNFSGTPVINKAEVKDWKYLSLAELEKEIEKTPEDFTPWFKIILEKLGIEHLPK